MNRKVYGVYDTIATQYVGLFFANNAAHATRIYLEGLKQSPDAKKEMVLHEIGHEEHVLNMAKLVPLDMNSYMEEKV